MLLAPRIRMLDPAEGSPDADDTTTPGALPCNRLTRSFEVTSLNLFPLITETELDSCDTCLEEYPTTTTSFSLFKSSSSTTDTSFDEPIVTSCGLYPI